MKTIQVKEFNPKTHEAFIWEETGNGSLRRVDYIRNLSTDPWAVTGQCSWCVCGSDTLYVFNSEVERRQVEETLRARLANCRTDHRACTCDPTEPKNSAGYRSDGFIVCAKCHGQIR